MYVFPLYLPSRPRRSIAIWTSSWEEVYKDGKLVRGQENTGHEMLMFLFLAMTSASRSLVSSPSSTPSNGLSYVCSTRARSTSLSTSGLSRPVPSAADSPRRTPQEYWRRPRSASHISPCGSSLSRYEGIPCRLAMSNQLLTLCNRLRKGRYTSFRG